MNNFLTRLGVPPELQAFFNSDDPLLNPEYEEAAFDNSFYHGPDGTGLWLAGNETATELIITNSALEAIAFLTVNAYRYPLPDALFFIALGNIPHARQLNWIRHNRQKRKVTLVFSSDLPGCLHDITVACGLNGNAVRLVWSDSRIKITAGNRQFAASPDELTLNSFEKTAGIRTGIRTRKPNRFNTFLEQLKYDNQ
jgi:hypothetical protein